MSIRNFSCCLGILVTLFVGPSHLLFADDDATDEEQIRRLIPAATSIKFQTLERIATRSTSPTRDSFPNPSLTAELMFVSLEETRQPGSQFRYLTERAPKANSIAKEMNRGTIGAGRFRVPLAPVSMIHSDRITEFSAEVEDGTGTGSFKFVVPELYSGEADFVAHKEEDAW